MKSTLGKFKKSFLSDVKLLKSTQEFQVEKFQLFAEFEVSLYQNHLSF